MFERVIEGDDSPPEMPKKPTGFVLQPHRPAVISFSSYEDGKEKGESEETVYSLPNSL